MNTNNTAAPITVTLEQMAKAFEAWENGCRATPSQYLTADECAAADGVDDKLVGCTRRAGAAPEFDKEEGGHEAEFPEEEPVEKIEGEEDAEGGALQKEEERAEETGRLVNAPRSEEGDRAQDAGENHEHEAEAVEAEEIVNVEGVDPIVAFDERSEEHTS